MLQLLHPYAPVAALVTACQNERDVPLPRGLRNVGNRCVCGWLLAQLTRGCPNTSRSCFAAAALQCLLALRPFTHYLLTRPHPPCGRADCVLCELTALVTSVESGSASSHLASLAPLVAGIRRLGSQFTAYRQADAHDFVLALLDAAHLQLLADLGGELRFDPVTRETSGVYHLFSGCTRACVRCSRCGGVSASHTSFLELSLEVAGRVSSVLEALQSNFAGGEELSERLHNAYRCDACQALTTARRSVRVCATPNLLVLALKRYTSGFFGKLNKRVTYEATLDLGPFTSARAKASAQLGDRSQQTPEEAHDEAPASAPPAEPANVDTPLAPQLPSVPYLLMGVLVHLDWALSTASGHYICFVRRGDQWFKCDDASVVEVPESVALSQNAYLLFYAAQMAMPAPEARPPWVTDTPQEAAEEERRIAAAILASAQAQRRQRSSSSSASSLSSSDGENAEDADSQLRIPDHVLMSHGAQPAPGLCADGSDEPLRVWPEQLRLKLNLPRVRRAAEVNIAICGQQVTLRVPERYYMASTLPFPVNGEDYVGTFSLEHHTLEVLMEVVPQPRALPGRGAAQQQQAPAELGEGSGGDSEA